MWVSHIRGTMLGVPVIRTIVCWGAYWGPPILEYYQMDYGGACEAT